MEESVLNTLKYSAIFSFPLNTNEIHKFLICKKYVDEKKIEIALSNLYKQKKIVKKADFYSVLGAKNAWFTNRKKSSEICENIVKKVKKDLWLFRFVPSVKFIGITGSVAAKNIQENGDIDLFFITRKNAVWLSRFITVLYLKIIRKYKKVYCANIYINYKDLIWSNQNIYIANEIVRIIPVINKNNIFEKFIYQNDWIFKYLKNFEKYAPKKIIKPVSFIDKMCEKLTLILDFNLFALQYFYMKRKITSEKITRDKILFLKNDYSDTVLNKYNSKHLGK